MTATSIPTTGLPKQASRTTWTIHVEKEYLKFSAAHFLIFEDGTAERLHGHNYRVAVEIAARNETHGMVVDFKAIKPRIARILSGLDERLLIPGIHPELTCEDDNGSWEIRYRERRYVVPREDVVVLPITNTSSENLAHWIATTLADDVQQRFPAVRLGSLSVSVEETAGQRGMVTLDF